MLISNIINDSFGVLSKQLRFYCWHWRRNLDQRQKQELIDLLYEQHFERLANKIRILNQDSVSDGKQQIGKLLFEHCLTRSRRHQLIQLIESKLVDINVRLDNYGRTLLHRAAYNLDVELVKILIENGANIRLRDYAGNTALHISIQSYRNGAVIYGDGPDVVQNLTSIIRLLLEADRNLQNEHLKRKKTEELSSNINDCNLGDSPENDISEGVLPVSEVDPRQGSISRSTCSFNRLKMSDSTLTQHNSANLQSSGIDGGKNNEPSKYSTSDQGDQDFSKQLNFAKNLNPNLLEDSSSTLIDTKNAFGRTALHYCVLCVGEQHLAHFVELLIFFGADTDATDTRMKTPLYCLVKRPGVTAIRQKIMAVTHLLESGCDDLGLAIDPRSFFTETKIESLNQDIANVLHPKPETPPEPIFTCSTFKRVPSLKHMARLHLIRSMDEKTRERRQVKLSLPHSSPASLNLFVNRKILDQSELF